MVFEKATNILSALSNALASVAIPSPRLLHDILRPPKGEHIAFARDAFAIQDVKLSFAEWSGNLVLDHLDLGAGADHHVAFLDRRDAANVDAHRGVELERAATGRRFRIAEHNPDFFADLINKN